MKNLVTYNSQPQHIIDAIARQDERPDEVGLMLYAKQKSVS